MPPDLASRRPSLPALGLGLGFSASIAFASGRGGSFTIAALGGGPVPEDFGLVGEAFAGASFSSGSSLSLSLQGQALDIRAYRGL